MTAAPSFIAASMTSQICTQLGSIIRTRSPRFDPVAAEVDGDAVRALSQLGVAEPDLGAVLLDEVEGGAAVAVGDDVEPVERPVEPVEHRPVEL